LSRAAALPRLPTRPSGDITFRRLVLDETDLRVTNQLHRGAASRSGEVKPVVLFFSDVAGFTSFSETLTPYDVMYLLNRYFTQVGELIERNDGYIDKFVGDGPMAIFGVEGQPDAPIRSVNAALQNSSRSGPQSFQSGAASRYSTALQTETLRCVGLVG
jgi:class 3 adenylate cyclase